MWDIQQTSISIDLTLRFVLFGLECVYLIETSGRETNRVFRDSRADQVSTREYVFFERSDLKISGIVEAYEPETILLCVETSGKQRCRLADLVEKAQSHVQSLNRFEDY